MARTEITNISIADRNTAVAGKIATAAVGQDTDTKYKAVIDYTGRDDSKILVIVENASESTAKTATIKAGNMLQGTSDLAISLGSLSGATVVLESGKFKNSDGEVIIEGSSADIKVAAVELP